MNNRKNYNIEQLYVGELYLSYNLIIGHKLNELNPKEKETINQIILNGAIDFQKDLFKKYTDWKNQKQYHGVLTLFYKEKEEFICLHNGKNYTTNGIDFCEHLIPLPQLLPKISYNMPNTLSLKESLYLFNTLFHPKYNHKLINIHNKDLYNTNDFYIGNLSLHDGFRSNDFYQRYIYYNLVESYLAYNNGATISHFFGIEDQKFDEEKNRPIGLHDYKVLKCIFLKLNETKMYNLNNFQIYQNGTFESSTPDSDIITENYYDNLKPLKEVMEKKHIKLKDSTTIPKVLKLSRNINWY